MVGAKEMKVVDIKDFRRKPALTFKQCGFLHKYEMVESVEVRTCFGDKAVARLFICKNCGERKVTKDTKDKLTAGHTVILDRWLLGQCHDLYYAGSHDHLNATAGDYGGEKWRYVKRS
jgi:hypothetical protein